MRFNFIHSGKRFFFVTLVTKGRAAVLSRRVKNEIVELLPAGERVKAEWAASHSRDEAVTASNFVIMPDHVHLLLIVDFEKNRTFDVLDWIMHFIRATGDWELWDRHLYFQLSFSLAQLKAIRRYIKMNPARAWWKECHPDAFKRLAGFRHAVLGNELGNGARERGQAPEPPKEAITWTAYGSLPLLSNPFLFQVRLTTKKTLDELEGEISAAVEKARRGWVPVSGFLSPGEREFLRRIKLEHTTRWIKMVPYGLSPKFDPSVEDSQYLAEGRELILSSFPVDVPRTPITRANCLLMNERIAELCARAAGLAREGNNGTGASPRAPLGEVREKPWRLRGYGVLPDTLIEQVSTPDGPR